MYDQFREERVEFRTGREAAVAIAIDAHSWSRWRLVNLDHAGGRKSDAVGAHGLQVEPELDGEAVRIDATRMADSDSIDGLARRDPELGLYQIDASHFFGDGVLDLQPRIGLDEDEALFPAGRRQKLERAEPGIPTRCGQAALVRASRADEDSVGLGAISMSF